MKGRHSSCTNQAITAQRGARQGRPIKSNKRKQTNRGRNKGNKRQAGYYRTAAWNRSSQLGCQLAPGPSPSPPLSHPATPAGSGAAFSNAILAAAGKAALLQSWRHLWSFPPLFLFLALAAGTPELAGIYLKFPSKQSSHRLGERFLSAPAFVWLLLQRCR